MNAMGSTIAAMMNFVCGSSTNRKYRSAASCLDVIIKALAKRELLQMKVSTQ